MRFEAKHLYFKQVAARTNNFKNICKTLAFRHQMKQCYLLTSKDILRQNEQMTGLHSVLLSTVTDTVKLQLLHACSIEFDDTDPGETIFKVKSLTLDKVKYKIKDVFVLELIDGGEIPLFFRIVSIIKFRTRWVLLGKCLRVIQYDDHLCSYIVQEMHHLCSILPGQEVDHQSLDLYSLEDGRKCVMMMYRPCPK